MTTATKSATSQVEQVDALLEKAEERANQAATDLTDVVTLCTDEADGERLLVQEALALLGRAYLVRRSARWTVGEADKAIEQLVFQVQLAEEHVERSIHHAS
ncbi:MAG: hypothetical protein H0T97_01970 [Actinobacteria bacterium]|nr:hypothetical protein [Actinomycetota bacterium]